MFSSDIMSNNLIIPMVKVKEWNRELKWKTDRGREGKQVVIIYEADSKHESQVVCGCSALLLELRA